MKQYISLLLCLTGLVLGGCKWRENVFDFADPLPPPVSHYESGTYDVTFTAYLESPEDRVQDDADGERRDPPRVYYTFDPDLPFTDIPSWTDYNASEFKGINVDRSMNLRAFSYSSETRFSEVKTFAWELKCPNPGFSQEPGEVTMLPANIGIKAIQDWRNPDAFSVYYTTDGSDPSSPESARSLWTFFQENDPSTPLDNEEGTPPFYLNESSPPLSLRVVVQREGWSDSDVVSGTFIPTPLSAVLDFTIGLPDGTVVSFTGQSPVLRMGSDAMTVSAQPAGMAKYEWSLNGMSVYVGSGTTNPYQGSSLRLGHIAPSNNLYAVFGATTIDLSNLADGSYTLTCIATAGNGFAYSNSILFFVEP